MKHAGYAFKYLSLLIVMLIFPYGGGIRSEQ